MKNHTVNANCIGRFYVENNFQGMVAALFHEISDKS